MLFRDIRLRLPFFGSLAVLLLLAGVGSRARQQRESPVFSNSRRTGLVPRLPDGRCSPPA
jgi:hypothetical protein